MIISPDSIISKDLAPEDIKILEELDCSEKIIAEKISSFGDEIKITENLLGRFLKFGNHYQGGKINYKNYKGIIPYVNYFFLTLSMKPSIKKVLVLGLGTGDFINKIKEITPEISKIDVVELNPEVACFAEDFFGFDKTRTEIHIQDARVFIRNSKEKYDLIIMDVFSEAGMDYRFMTAEFLEEAQKILNDDGIFATNVFGLADINSENNIIFKSMLKTHFSVFKDVLIFPAVYGNYEFYTKLIGLNQDFCGLTNIILFSSPDYIDIKTSKVLKIMDKTGINLDKYVQDFYLPEVNIENARIFLDNDENGL